MKVEAKPTSLVGDEMAFTRKIEDGFTRARNQHLCAATQNEFTPIVTIFHYTAVEYVVCCLVGEGADWYPCASLCRPYRPAQN